MSLTNWRFLDRLGFSAARWMGGFGCYASIRAPMVVNGHAAPFHPDQPIVMTFDVPFAQPDAMPLAAQGARTRTELLATGYAEHERGIVAQMIELFAAGGFDARRDIAGIVLDRGGHAFVSPPPGFSFGNGGPAPVHAADQPFGRIAFGQPGLEDWLGAAHAGRRAVGRLAAAW